MRSLTKLVFALVVLPLVAIIVVLAVIGLIFRIVFTLLPIIIVAFVIYMIYKKFTQATVKAGSFDDAIRAKSQEIKQETQVVMGARGYLRRIDALKAVIRDASLRAKITNLTNKANDIIAKVRENPKHIGSVTTFMDYYLPATVKILERYADIERNNLTSAEAARLKERVPGFLDDICSSFSRQLEALYNDEILDASAEMEALKTTLATDGLLAGNDFKI